MRAASVDAAGNGRGRGAAGHVAGLFVQVQGALTGGQVARGGAAWPGCGAAGRDFQPRAGGAGGAAARAGRARRRLAVDHTGAHDHPRRLGAARVCAVVCPAARDVSRGGAAGHQVDRRPLALPDGARGGRARPRRDRARGGQHGHLGCGAGVPARSRHRAGDVHSELHARHASELHCHTRAWDVAAGAWWRHAGRSRRRQPAGGRRRDRLRVSAAVGELHMPRLWQGAARQAVCGDARRAVQL
mmetsp:Transcript_37229/g.109924  ORF Transcript_37229/g.109924 Transcript_37229/m.109924 type:complete len:244 (+) Transcript_37229:294-1025(+)